MQMKYSNVKMFCSEFWNSLNVNINYFTKCAHVTIYCNHFLSISRQATQFMVPQARPHPTQRRFYLHIPEGLSTATMLDPYHHQVNFSRNCINIFISSQAMLIYIQ